MPFDDRVRRDGGLFSSHCHIFQGRALLICIIPTA